jgi:hypothetical protein
MLDQDREAILSEYQEGLLGDPAQVSASSVSLILKHLAIYGLVIQEADRPHLILEDDVLLAPSFFEKLAADVEQLPTEWDLFFVGLGCDLHVPFWRRRPGKRVYWRGWKPQRYWGGGGCSRCTEAYLIHPDFARRLLHSPFGVPPFSAPIDWHLNHAGVVLKARSYWLEPALVRQRAFES